MLIVIEELRSYLILYIMEDKIDMLLINKSCNVKWKIWNIINVDESIFWEVIWYHK